MSNASQVSPPSPVFMESSEPNRQADVCMASSESNSEQTGPFCFNELALSLPRIALQTHQCTACSLAYHRTWYHPSNRRCFFCMRFNGNITRYALLRETEWFFIQSGEGNARAYYETYITLLHRWADIFRLPYTPKDLSFQVELLQSLPDSL